MAWGSHFSTPLNQIQSATAGVLESTAGRLKKERQRETERDREQETEHVRQNAEAAILPLVV